VKIFEWLGIKNNSYRQNFAKLTKIMEKVTNYDVSGKIFVCPEKNFDLPSPPPHQQFLGGIY
jgi:hypothetical protein